MSARGPRLTTRVTDLAAANAFVQRHHRPLPGHRLSLDVRIAGTDTVVGVAILGNPVARGYQDGTTWEVRRTCTDGTRNANSCLYGACERLRKALGLDRMITYTQKGESGASLKAAGWRLVHVRPANRGWDRPSRRRDNTRYPTGIERYLWLTGTPWPERHEISGFCHEMQPTCAACGQPLPIRTGAGRPRVVCSDPCRYRAYRRRRDTPRPDVPPVFVATGGLFEDVS